jgi:hypothetical protein
MEYYNQVVFGNKDLIPKCKWCNGNLTFKSLGRGYGGDLCSPRCTNYWRNNYGDGGFNNPKCRERNIESNKERMKNGTWHLSTPKMKELLNSKVVRDKRRISHSKTSKRKYLEGTHNFNNPLVYIKSRYTDFIRSGNPSDTCYFYMAETNEGELKIGVTIDPDYRINHWTLDNPYKYLNILYENDRLKIGLLEKLVKESCIEYKISNQNEIFKMSDKDNIIKLINKIAMDLGI